MIEIGDSYYIRKIATEEIINRIADVSGDMNPVHINETYAKESLFGRKIAHGLFCLNTISEIIGNYLPGPGAILTSQDFIYKKPVYIGDEIETCIIVEKIDREKEIYYLKGICINQNKDVVLESMNMVKYKKKQFQISDFISILGGQIISDGKFETLEYCTSGCKVPFVTFIENTKYLKQLNNYARCVITNKNNLEYIPGFVEGIVLADEPKEWFIRLHNYLASNIFYSRSDFETRIGNNCNISPLAYVAGKNVIIGDNVYIGAFTVVKENVILGNNVIIHENCVIGGKSFNFVKTENDCIQGMADLGQVIIDDNVEICPLCHIAGCPLPTDITKLGKDVKLDAMVHVGHGTKIGDRTEIPAGAQIAGNCDIGEDAWIGVNATIANRIIIGNHGKVSLGSVVTKNVLDNQTVTGNFAVEHDRFLTELRESNKKALQTFIE